MGAVRIGGVQEGQRWELVYPHAWFAASGIRWPGPVICHCHVILSFSSPAVLLAALENNRLVLAWEPRCTSPPTFSHADFVLFFFSVPTAVAVNSTR